MFIPPKRLRAIFLELGFDELSPENCAIVAEKLNKYNERGEWSGSYIRNIMQGKQKASRFIIPAIMKLTIDPRVRHLCAVDMLTEADKLRVQNIPMETRRKILLEAVDG